MSLGTWKEEFYPIPAEECTKKGALQHSLTKWLGARPAALKRHAVVLNGARLKSGGEQEVLFDSNACALCQKWHCGVCPLYKVAPRACSAIHGQFIEMGDPEPMIRALRRTLKKQAAARS